MAIRATGMNKRTDNCTMQTYIAGEAGLVDAPAQQVTR